MFVLWYGDTVLFEVPSMFWGLASSAIIIRYTKGWLLFFMAGIMSAFSFLTKQFGAGFIVLNAYILLFSEYKQKGMSLLYYGLGVLSPILLTFALLGKEFFISTLLNGYGTTTNALKGEDISLPHKISAIVHGFKIFLIMCPVVLYVLFFPLIHKAKRWRDFLFCVFGLVGFSLQFYFVYPYSHHYFQYLVPFAALLIPVFMSIHPNKIVCTILVLCFLASIGKCVRWSVVNPLKEHAFVNIHTSEQAMRAQRIKKEIHPTRTLWIANTGLQCYYYLTNAATPNMAEVGYSAGPWEITIERATMQVDSADYILCYYDTTEVKPFNYYFTEDLREFTYQHPFVDLGDNIRLYTMKSY